MTTNVDICNQALISIGIQKVITSLTQDSAEARACNSVYTYIRDWCLGLVNWNFARKTTSPALLKTTTGIIPWNENTSPPPPWRYEYAYPADALMIRYVTNTDIAKNTFIGEPKRFVAATDTIAGVVTRVWLTDEAVGICIYTRIASDPTDWPWYFERLMISALGRALSLALTGDKEIFKLTDMLFKEDLTMSVQSNRAEGLIFDDNTPEWIQALGINYPYNRGSGGNVGGRRSQPKSKDDSDDD